ncbi:SDR family NAD(P)-dependent oxidoreductase [Acidisphaera sp. L21]|uniref:SDR family NAD(P)-dependent oxidoreductase n=1 Tax=Acidisphaera sp. L21 TaxID=1641851 RepID=UPI00131CAF98|nr:SDR family NAD(P)-dependent oxidoreductase [Acidisphaera sp. L21]
MDIDGSVFVVTGGASGLGAATTRMLVSAGARVVVADVNHRAGEQIAAELAGAVRFIPTDVTQEADGQAAIALAQQAFGGLHGLANCAGIAHGEKVVGKDGPHALAAFTRVVMVNLVGTFNMTRLAAAAMAGNTPNAGGERGVIICTASIAAFDGQVGQAAYAASKAGVAGMTLPIARDLARNGIRIATIAPGLFRTPMMEGLPAEVQQSLGASVPFPSRLGEPAEYAGVVRFVVETPMLNGEVIRLDGALRMAPR